MSTICLSHAPILRCVGVTHTFAATLLIPPVLALFFGLSLLFVRRNGDKYVQMNYVTCYTDKIQEATTSRRRGYHLLHSLPARLSRGGSPCHTILHLDLQGFGHDRWYVQILKFHFSYSHKCRCPE
jgi:hypothetical protein